MGRSGAAWGEVELDSPAGVREMVSRLRQHTALWVRRERERGRLDAGLEELNRALGGGWPVGKVGEVVGPASSGRTSAAVAAVAAATRRGEVVAWIEVGGSFDPATAAQAGVVLERVLWVRTPAVAVAVRAAEIVLEVGGFSVVVVDLVAGEQKKRGREGSLPLRLVRATERANAVGLVVAESPWVGPLAGARVVLVGGEGEWIEGEGGGGGWLAGVRMRVAGERGGEGRAVSLRPLGGGKGKSGAGCPA